MEEIFYKDSFTINELNFQFEKAREALQTIVSEFEKIGITIKEAGQIAGLVDKNRKLIDENLDSFVFSRLFLKIPAKMDPEKYRKLVELPDLSTLRESFEGLNIYLGGLRIPDIVYWQIYVIENGKVKINPAEKEKIESRYIEVAQTTDEKERLEAVQDVCTALNSLVKLAEDHPVNYALKGCAVWDEGSKQFRPEKDFIKRGSVSFGMLFGMESKTVNLKSTPAKSPAPEITADTPEAARAAAMASARNQA